MEYSILARLYDNITDIIKISQGAFVYYKGILVTQCCKKCCNGLILAIIRANINCYIPFI